MLLQHSWIVFTSIFVLLSLVDFTSAGPQTVPFQVVLDYYTYRSVVLAYGAEQKKMLALFPGPGSHALGGANFLEFENFVSPIHSPKRQLTVDDYAQAGITDLDNPDVYKARDLLKDKKKTQASTGFKKGVLFNDKEAGFYSTLEKEAGLLYEATKKNYDDSKQNRQQPYLDKIQVALEEIIALRTSEMNTSPDGARGFVGFLKEKYPGIVPKFDETQWHHDQSVTLYEFNAAETVEESKASSQALDMEVLKEDYNTYMDADPTASDKEGAHARTLLGYSYFKNIVMMKCRRA